MYSLIGLATQSNQPTRGGLRQAEESIPTQSGNKILQISRLEGDLFWVLLGQKRKKAKVHA